ncbi:MAG: hypothetical protein H7Y43_08135 [Akkermansiaceae bacterium]|nr:hypothetical protein [Verrucomicrobiales bacterium]
MSSCFSTTQCLFRLAVLLLPTGGWGAGIPGEYLTETWDTSSGLPHSTVRTVAQTPDGYLWVATENGLARFDGVRFETFVRENTPPLKNPSIDFLEVDACGVLWVGAGRHVLTWNGRKLVDQDWPVPAGDWIARLLRSNSNEVLFATGAGRLMRGKPTTQGRYEWNGSSPAGFSMFALDQRDEIWRLSEGAKLTRLGSSGTEPALIPEGVGLVTCLVNDVSGRIWIGTEHRLLLVEQGNYRSIGLPEGESDFQVHEIFPMRDGSLWVVANGSIWKWKDEQWVLNAGRWPTRAPLLRKMMEDREGDAWFGRFGMGLVRLGKDGSQTLLNAEDGLPGDRARCLFEDREGNLWAGFDRGGLVRLRQKQFQVLGTKDGLSDPVVLGVCEDGEGAIWASTYGGGLNRWADGKFTSFNLGPDNSPGYVFNVFPDRAGRLWVSTRDNGIFIREAGEFRHEFPSNTIPATVRAIFQDRDGVIWLGSGAGAFQWREGRLEPFGTNTELAKADVRAFAEDSEGALWIGTQGSGLHRFQSGQHTALHAADGLPNEFVRSLFADTDGTLWIGLYGGGLFRWKAGRLSRAAPPENLPDDVICQFEDDGRGRLWISTHHGLFRVAKADLHAFAEGRQSRVPCVAYGKFDGLPTLEFSGGLQPAGWRDRAGRLWFASDKGLISLQPDSITLNPLPPPVAVESLRVDGKLFASSRDQGAGIHNLGGSLRIPAGRTQFEFHFTGLSFIAPDKVRFQYRLEGLQKEWNDAGMTRSVAYNYLSPGEYQFRVRAANNDGVWNEQGATVGFELLPHVWQRGWFRALLVVAIIALAWLAYYLRMARLRELERLRLRIARDLHDDVGANLASLALIAEAMEKQPSFGDPADLRRIALHTIDSLRDIVWFIDPARDNLGDLVSRMRDTAPALLTGIRFSFETNVPNPGIYLPPAFRRNIFPIFKETLHNASRHAQASRIDIELDCREGVLRLKIADNGCGFDETAIIPGNGLRNLRRRALEMKGVVRIQSAPGRGTVVEFQAPFPQMRGLGFGFSRVSSMASAINNSRGTGEASGK